MCRFVLKDKRLGDLILDNKEMNRDCIFRQSFAGLGVGDAVSLAGVAQCVAA